ncbi:MAG TPA: glycosyltransferase family 39 protein, partial [Chitinophagales bacterium]|nr:glycosyltransferase family 39 protein [Chitinophagales bacterium]
MQLTNNRYIPWLLALVTGVVLLPGLGVAHLFDWDEINFAEIAREMTVSGNYSQPTMRFLPFWEKPPLFFWLQALGMEVFGVGEFAARLPNVICGMITIPLLYTIGRRLFDETFGMIWAMA